MEAVISDLTVGAAIALAIFAAAALLACGVNLFAWIARRLLGRQSKT